MLRIRVKCPQCRAFPLVKSPRAITGILMQERERERERESAVYYTVSQRYSLTCKYI